MGNRFSFVRALAKDWRRTGAIAPSSQFLANEMVRTIDFHRARRIAELGPGTGVFTRVLLQKMHPECTLIAYELGEDFCVKLQRLRDPRLVVRHETAERIRLLSDPVEYIVSGLPLANFDPTSKKRVLLAAREVLLRGGEFVQFQYFLESRALLRRVFGNIETKIAIMNVPPVFVYRCTKQ